MKTGTLEKAPTNESAGILSAEKQARKDLDAQERIEIMIPSTEVNKEDVFIGVNGVAYQIKRDEWVKVPKSVVIALQHATYDDFEQKKREDGEGNDWIPRKVMRYPFQTKLN